MSMPLFIAFEGGEGSGKSTQVQRLSANLAQRGHTVFATHEPGATLVGKAIRSLLLETDEPITPRGEALLFAADRAHHVETEIRPALEAGCHVLCDRYIDSSIAYQGAGRGLSVFEVGDLSEWATGGLLPGLTVLLDIAPELGLVRAGKRSGPDRMEREELNFHRRIRDSFLMLAANDPDRYLVLDARRSADGLADEILAMVSARLSATDVVVHGESPMTSSPVKTSCVH